MMAENVSRHNYLRPKHFVIQIKKIYFCVKFEPTMMSLQKCQIDAILMTLLESPMGRNDATHYIVFINYSCSSYYLFVAPKLNSSIFR